MTDTKEKPTEAKPEQKRITVKNDVEIMLKALSLAETATGYKESGNETLIFYEDGRQQTKDPTLSHYIKKAEQAFIQKHAFAIIKDAGDILESEIGEIREILGC